MSLGQQVMAMELNTLAQQRRERAYPLAGFSVRWDKRTQDAQLHVDTRPLQRGWILFSHAQSVRDEMNLVCTIRFHDLAGSKTLPRADSEDPREDRYVNGIVGIDRVGAYEVMDSNWITSLGSTLERPVHHYCFVFADISIEVLAGEMVASSGQGRWGDILRELMGEPAGT